MFIGAEDPAPIISSQFAAALHLNSWVRAEPDRGLGDKHLPTSVHLQRVFFGLPSMAKMSVCATRWIKSLLYSYSKKSFQSKQYLRFAWNLSAHGAFIRISP